MSNKKLFLIFFAILVGFLISMTFSLVYAETQAGLKDGMTLRVPAPPHPPVAAPPDFSPFR